MNRKRFFPWPWPALLMVPSIAVAAMVGYGSWFISRPADSEADLSGNDHPDEKPVAFIARDPSVRYTTLSKAFASAVSGDIVILIPPELPNYHNVSNPVQPDQISYEIDYDVRIPSGVSFVIPTDNDSISPLLDGSGTLGTYLESLEDDVSHDQGNNYANYAKDNPKRYNRITLEIGGGHTLINDGTLVVSGYLGGGTSGVCTFGQTAHSYSSIVLQDGASIVQGSSEAKTYCYGYIEEENDGEGLFSLSGGELYSPFVVDDFRGIDYSWALTAGPISDYHVAPFNRFYMPNVESKLVISSSSRVYGRFNIYISYQGITDYSKKNLSIVGSDSSFFIELSEGSEIVYDIDPSIERADVDFYGGFSLNNLNIEFNIEYRNIPATVSFDIDEVYLPISYFYDIGLHPAGAKTKSGRRNAAGSDVFDFSRQRIKFLPGSRFEAFSGTRIESSDIVIYSAFYDGTAGNGEQSINCYDAKAYPLKEGASFLLDDGAVLDLGGSSIGGTVYGGEGTIVNPGSTSVVSREPWCLTRNPATVPIPVNFVDQYLMINENLSQVPLSYFESKKKVFVGLNIFSDYESMVPSVDVYLNDETTPVNFDGVQGIVFSDTLYRYRLDFVSDVYRAYDESSYYQKDTVVEVPEGENAILGATNSIVEISNDNGGVNEFDVQSVSVTSVTPQVDGKDPLYVGKMINLAADVVDIDKAYDKTIHWSSSDDGIATVNDKGQVTGVSLGKVRITATCDGVSGHYDTEVIDEKELVKLESIRIVDDRGNSSDVGISNVWENTTGEDTTGEYWNAQYENNESITMSLELNPSDAPYSSIVWTLNASAVGRQWIDNSASATNTVSNVLSVTVHTGKDTGSSDDKATLTCTVVDLEGKSFTAKFIINHKNDFSVCFEEGTLIMMADGSSKPIESVLASDWIMAFDHFSGRFVKRPVLMRANHGRHFGKAVRLKFEDGREIEITSYHALLDFDERRYVNISAENAASFIGHRFYVYHGKKGSDGIATRLVDAKAEEKECAFYSIASYGTINALANGLLSATPPFANDGLGNFFKLDDNFAYERGDYRTKVSRYGFARLKELDLPINESFFEGIGGRYFSIGLGEGRIDRNGIRSWADYFVGCVERGEAAVPSFILENEIPEFGK